MLSRVLLGDELEDADRGRPCLACSTQFSAHETLKKRAPCPLANSNASLSMEEKWPDVCRAVFGVLARAGVTLVTSFSFS